MFLVDCKIVINVVFTQQLILQHFINFFHVWGFFGFKQFSTSLQVAARDVNLSDYPGKLPVIRISDYPGKLPVSVIRTSDYPDIRLSGIIADYPEIRLSGYLIIRENYRLSGSPSVTDISTCSHQTLR